MPAKFFARLKPCMIEAMTEKNTHIICFDFPTAEEQQSRRRPQLDFA